MEKPGRLLEMVKFFRDGKIWNIFRDERWEKLRDGKIWKFFRDGENIRDGKICKFLEMKNLRDGKYWLEIEKYGNF